MNVLMQKLQEEGDRLDVILQEIINDSQNQKRHHELQICKQLYTKMTYIFRNVFQECEQPVGELQVVDSLKKSVKKHKLSFDELSKAIEQTLNSDEECESSEIIHSNPRTSWGEKIVHFEKSVNDLLGQTLNWLMKMYSTSYAFPQVMQRSFCEVAGLTKKLQEENVRFDIMLQEQKRALEEKGIWKQLYTKITYVFSNVFQQPKQPLGQLLVEIFKKSVKKHKVIVDELSKVIEQTLNSDEDCESSERIHSNPRINWGDKIAHFAKSANDLLSQTLNWLVEMYIAGSRIFPRALGISLMLEPASRLQMSGMPVNCTSCSSIKDSRDWEIVLPEVVAWSANKNRKYRITSAPGRYECGVSGIRWESSCEVELEYCWIHWDLVSDFLERGQYHPCGPLMDITVIAGRLNAVHLPHFLCLGSESSLSDAVRVSHVKDDGVSIERCILSRFHATLLQPTFSPNGALVKKGFRVKAHCLVLIYRVLASHLTLHIYLIPDCLKIKEAIDNEERGKGVKIVKPNPESSLQMKKWYKLKTLPKKQISVCDSEITPMHLKLRYTTRTPNFFEVYVSNPTEDFYLQMLTDEDKLVWQVTLREDDFNEVSRSETIYEDSSIAYADSFVDKHRTALIERVSLVTPIADDLKAFIGNQKYSIIIGCKTPEEQMRKLYSFLSGGQEIKNGFYQSLQKNEPHLVAELQKLEGS